MKTIPDLDTTIYNSIIYTFVMFYGSFSNKNIFNMSRNTRLKVHRIVSKSEIVLREATIHLSLSFKNC